MKLPLPLPTAPHSSHYHLNHPPTPDLPKNCLPRNWSLVPKRLGTTAGERSSLAAAAAAAKSLQPCPTLCDPTEGSPPRLPHPWDSPGKNTGVGCHFLLQCMKVKSESEVAQSCVTLSNPMDCSLPGRLLHPWHFPGKSTGVGCHCLLWLEILRYD